MDIHTFWSLIESVQQKVDGLFVIEQEFLIAKLVQLSADEIQEFDRLFWLMMSRAYRADIWDAAWLVECGCGDDGFTDFRHWLIVQGEAIYEKVLEDPENLSEIVPKKQRFRYIGHGSYIGDTAALAYEQKFNTRIPETGYRERPVLQGETVGEDAVVLRFPRIAATIGKCDEEDFLNIQP